MAPSSERYLRMEIMVGGNIIRRVEGDDSKTHFTVLTHVNPGGVAETRLGAMILNSAAASGPLKFIHGLRKVAPAPPGARPPPASPHFRWCLVKHGRACWARHACLALRCRWPGHRRRTLPLGRLRVARLSAWCAGTRRLVGAAPQR